MSMMLLIKNDDDDDDDATSKLHLVIDNTEAEHIGIGHQYFLVLTNIAINIVINIVINIGLIGFNIGIIAIKKVLIMTKTKIKP